MTQEQAIECITRALPHPEHISKWEFEGKDAIRFTWGHGRFRVSLSGSLMVEQVENGMLAGGNLPIVIESLLKREWREMEDREARESAESGAE